MNYENLDKVLKQYGERTTQLAKLELGTYKPRKVRTSTWNGMTPTSTKVTMRKRRAVASGKLQNSIRFNIDIKEDFAIVEFIMLEYGKYVEEGRKAGKGVPPNALKKWITEDRKMRYFNRKTRRFESMTPSKLNALMFTINRSIKAFGIDARPFMKPSERRAMQEFADKIAKAFADDIEDDLTS